MASRYDYADPGTDPAYCDGLSADEDDQEAEDADGDADHDWLDAEPED